LTFLAVKDFVSHLKHESSITSSLNRENQQEVECKKRLKWCEMHCLVRMDIIHACCIIPTIVRVSFSKNM
jgi:hypothetical protein